MTAEDFVKQFYIEKKYLEESAFNDHGLAVARQIALLNLTETQRDGLKQVISSLLTDTFYSILLGLDGAANIGGRQICYKIQDEEGNELSGGDIEAFAYEYFIERESGC